MKLLLIESDSTYAHQLQEIAAAVTPSPCELVWVKNCAAGLTYQPVPAAVLLADTLPDCPVSQVVEEWQQNHPDVPLILLTDTPDIKLPPGVSDYLVRAEITPRLLERTVRYALKQLANLKKLRHSESTRQAILEAVPDVIIRYNRAGVYLDVFGQSAAQQALRVGRSVEQVLPPKLAKTTLQHISQALATGQMVVNEYDLKHNGQHHTIESRYAPCGPDEVIAIVRDITERKKTEEALWASEERFRRVVNSITHHIYMTEITADGERINHYLSPNVTALTGYPLEKFLDDWSFWPEVVIHPEDRQIAGTQADRLARGETSELEYRLTRADGRIIWVRDSARVEQVGSSKITYGAVSDISDSKRAQQEIVRLYLAERDRYQEAEALRRAAMALASTIDLGQVIEIILTELQNVVPYDSASVQLLEDESLTSLSSPAWAM